MKARDPALPACQRILIIDDNPSIHDDFRKVLGPRSETVSELEAAEAALFGAPKSASAGPEFDLAFAFQGEEGLAAVRAAAQEGRPFSMAFVDVRMPPGWDGIETIARISREYPEIQMAICSAYSDYSWSEIIAALGEGSGVLFVKKPFENAEVREITRIFSRKWHLGKTGQCG